MTFKKDQTIVLKKDLGAGKKGQSIKLIDSDIKITYNNLVSTLYGLRLPSEVDEKGTYLNHPHNKWFIEEYIELQKKQYLPEFL